MIVICRSCFICDLCITRWCQSWSMCTVDAETSWYTGCCTMDDAAIIYGSADGHHDDFVESMNWHCPWHYGSHLLYCVDFIVDSSAIMSSWPLRHSQHTDHLLYIDCTLCQKNGMSVFCKLHHPRYQSDPLWHVDYIINPLGTDHVITPFVRSHVDYTTSIYMYTDVIDHISFEIDLPWRRH